MVKFHVEQNGLEVVFKRIEAVEDAVVERLFAQVIPEMLDRIQFGRIGRSREQAQIGRGGKRTALMPARAVKDHDDPIIWMPLGDLVEAKTRRAIFFSEVFHVPSDMNKLLIEKPAFGFPGAARPCRGGSGGMMALHFRWSGYTSCPNTFAGQPTVCYVQ